MSFCWFYVVSQNQQQQQQQRWRHERKKPSQLTNEHRETNKWRAAKGKIETTTLLTIESQHLKHNQFIYHMIKVDGTFGASNRLSAFDLTLSLAHRNRTIGFFFGSNRKESERHLPARQQAKTIKRTMSN